MFKTLQALQYKGKYNVVCKTKERKRLTKNQYRDFPGGAVVKNLPANAGDTGSIPGPGRSHMPWSNKAHVLQLPSLHSRAHEPQLLKPVCPRAHALLLLSPRVATTEAHVL